VRFPSKPLQGTVMLSLMGLALTAAVPVTAQTAKPLPPSQMVSPKLLVTRIDTNCAVFKSAIKTQKPTDVIALHSTDWRLASHSELVAAENGKSAYTLAEVWKQAGNYQWVHAMTVTAGGGRHATQLCFRNDGSLSRAKQARTMPSLDSAADRGAYYNTDGSLIEKTATFEVNDPAIAKRIKELPYFKILP